MSKLYVDPIKARIWATILALLLVWALLWGIPKYYRWLRLQDAETNLQIEQLRKAVR